MKGEGITKRGIIIIVLIIILVALAAIYYYVYSSSNTCDTDSCFTNALAKCDKTTYVRDDGTEILQYKILGTDEFKCSINVMILQVKTGTAELGVIEGKEMTCFIPFGSVTDPARDLENCHGLLKEEIQNIMIQRLHAQIIQNLDKINEEKII